MDPRQGRRTHALARACALLRGVACAVPASMLAVALALLLDDAHAAPPYFADVVLEDPRGKEWPLGALTGHATLLVIADRAGSDDALAWGKGAGEARTPGIAHWAEPGKLVVVSVLDLRAVPDFARGTARWLIVQMIEETKPAGPPRLLDWEGVVAKPAGAEEGVATVRLHAPDGTLVHQDAGAPTPEKLARLLAAIDDVLATVAQPASAPTPTASPARGAE